MKRYLFTFLLVLCCISLSAQKLELYADFVQTKESVIFEDGSTQKGYVRFISPDSLVWCYTYPVEMKVEFSGKSGNAFSDIKELITSIIKGDFDSKRKDFTVNSVPAEDGTSKITVTPRSQRARGIFKSMEILTQKDVRIANRIIICEQNGDITTIQFSNQKLNVE